MPKSPTRPGQCARPLRRPGPKPMLHLPSHWPTQRLENLLEQRHRLPPNSHGQAARIAGVEDGFSVDVGQAKRVAVAADAAHHSVKHPAGIGGVYGGAVVEIIVPEGVELEAALRARAQEAGL